MDKLIICETDRGRYAVRPMRWAGIWNEKGQIRESLNHLALFIEKEDAEKFVEWKETEEQGKLLKLPCAVGETVYVIPSSKNFGINIVNRHEENNRVYEQIVDHVEMRRSGYLLSTCDGMACVIEEFYKETWFTDKKGAEVKLKELERYWKKVFKEKK